ncbi:MAG: hypothetical protein MK008_13870 [Bdellovibrionales bacterium]|nr:hypothetical protein [Bdellovibrionales bacterium]
MGFTHQSFKNFEPNQELKKFSKNLIQQLEMKAPSDSFLDMGVESGKGLFKVSLKVVSEVGVFLTESLSTCPLEALNKANFDMCEKINQWKKTRFLKAS